MLANGDVISETHLALFMECTSKPTMLGFKGHRNHRKMINNIDSRIPISQHLGTIISHPISRRTTLSFPYTQHSPSPSIQLSAGGI